MKRNIAVIMAMVLCVSSLFASPAFADENSADPRDDSSAAIEESSIAPISLAELLRAWTYTV